MNVIEMHIAVQQGVDKINSLQADSLLSEEIDLELNKSLDRFINLKYGRNNLYGKGFEESQKRIDDLRTLVREYEGSVTFKEQLKEKIFVDTFRLPSDYMYLVNQLSTLWINKCQPITSSFLSDEEIYYFTLDFNNFVQNNANNDSIAFLSAIAMYEDYANSATTISSVIWNPSSELLATGYTSTSYPSNMDAVKQDILNNPGPGVTIYWEEFETINAPGQFIVVVDYESHPWFETDASIGPVTQATGWGVSAAGTPGSPLVYADAQVATESYSEKRVPAESDATQITEGNRFSQQDDIFTLLSDPFNTTKHTSPLTTIRGQAIDVYTSDIFIIDTVKITYIRRPMEISLSLGVDCELPTHTHQEIVSMAVSSILEEISDPRYKTAIREASQNE
jgi:hypothetical protein